MPFNSNSNPQKYSCKIFKLLFSTINEKSTSDPIVVQWWDYSTINQRSHIRFLSTEKNHHQMEHAVRDPNLIGAPWETYPLEKKWYGHSPSGWPFSERKKESEF